MPNISVIIPCYNVEQYVDRCLRSMIEQTLRAELYEIICVDDCSTDSTWAILQKWEQKYPERIKIIQNAQNGRQGQARNIGLQYAIADWIAFVDADDWVEPEYLAEMIQFTDDSTVDAICCGCQRDADRQLSYFQNATEKQVKLITIDTEEQRKQLIINPVLTYAAYAKLIRKQFIIENRLFFVENISYEDVLWGSLFHLYVKRAVMIQRPLYHYFVNDVSTVLTQNADHHLDIITIQILCVQEWEKRGFMHLYSQELELEYMYSGYLAGLKVAILRFKEPNYHMYLLLKALTLQRFPNWQQNQYIKHHQMKELHLLMLRTLLATLTPKEFLEFAENVKRIGI